MVVVRGVVIFKVKRSCFHEKRDGYSEAAAVAAAAAAASVNHCQ